MTTTPSHTHPVLACAHAMQAALLDVADVDPMYMNTSDKKAALVALSRALTSASALQARLLAASEDVAFEHGARSAAYWLADDEQLDPYALRRAFELGRSLESAPLLAGAMAAGRITPDKATIIIRALDGLPDHVPTELRERAESALVEQAYDLAPKALSRVARHLEAIIDPDTSDTAEAQALLREERSAWEQTSLRIVDRYDGTSKITGTLPTTTAARLRTYLEAFAQPRKREDQTDPGTKRPRPDQLTGRAMCDLLEHINPATLPHHGGDTTTIMVTIGLTDLRSELGAAAIGGTDSEDRISAADVRRLACTAHLIPAVLGSKSQILDLGRASRLFTAAQRKALRTQHSVCQIDGCDIPSAWCDAHHERPWARGGTTDLKNALLVCGHHHRKLHDPRYTSARTGDQIQIRLRR